MAKKYKTVILLILAVIGAAYGYIHYNETNFILSAILIGGTAALATYALYELVMG